MKYPSVHIDIGIFDNLRSKEVMFHEADIRTLVLGYHVVSHIDILHDEL